MHPIKDCKTLNSDEEHQRNVHKGFVIFSAQTCVQIVFVWFWRENFCLESFFN